MYKCTIIIIINNITDSGVFSIFFGCGGGEEFNVKLICVLEMVNFFYRPFIQAPYDSCNAQFTSNKR